VQSFAIAGSKAFLTLLCWLACIWDRAAYRPLLYFSGCARIFCRAVDGLLLSFFKPCRDASRRYCALGRMRNDRSGGHDQAVVEFGAREILGLRFALKGLGRPRAPASNGCASPRDFEGHIPSMHLHPMIPMDLPPSITSAGQCNAIGPPTHARRCLTSNSIKRHCRRSDVIHFRDLWQRP